MDKSNHDRERMVISPTSSWQHGFSSNQSSLRFRPIAPKPAKGEGDPSVPQENIMVRVSGSKRGRKRNKTRFLQSGYLNERKEEGDSNKKIVSSKGIQQGESSLGCSSSIQNLEDETQLPPMVEATAESWVTVEFAMNIACPNKAPREKGDNNEVEILRYLETDACPGFVTDFWNNVTWVNEAYKKMVSEGRQMPNFVTLWLVIKEELRPRIRNCSGFSCWLNLKYTWSQEVQGCGQSRIMMVPCDVYRLERHGGFAWRLDLAAALRLGS